MFNSLLAPRDSCFCPIIPLVHAKAENISCVRISKGPDLPVIYYLPDGLRLLMPELLNLFNYLSVPPSLSKSPLVSFLLKLDKYITISTIKTYTFLKLVNR